VQCYRGVLRRGRDVHRDHRGRGDRPPLGPPRIPLPPRSRLCPWRPGRADRLLLLALAALAAAVGLNLRTYDRLTHEIPVATVSFQAQGDQRFSAVLVPATGRTLVFDMHGTNGSWTRGSSSGADRNGAGIRHHLPARSIRRALPRCNAGAEGRRSVHRLSEEPGLDIWAWTRMYPRWLPGWTRFMEVRRTCPWWPARRIG